MKRTHLFALTLASVVAVAAGIGAYHVQQRPQQPFNATDITGVPWAHDFELTDHHGQPRRLADFRGKVVLMFFGYTHCPDACPTALAELAQVVDRLGADADRVQVLFITTDPARDTEQRLATYVTAFHPRFLGLRGNGAETARVAADFKVHFRADPPKADAHAGHGGHEHYMVDHSTGILAFDRAGRPRLYISANGRSVDAMADDVRRLLGA